MNGVQCYELFGGIALKNHAFFNYDNHSATKFFFTNGILCHFFPRSINLQVLLIIAILSLTIFLLMYSM